MWHDMTGADWGWMVFGMGVLWLVLLAIGVGVISALTGGWATRASAEDARRGARDLLDDRLARGELDVEEYQARCRALEDARH